MVYHVNPNHYHRRLMYWNKHPGFPNSSYEGALPVLMYSQPAPQTPDLD